MPVSLVQLVQTLLQDCCEEHGKSSDLISLVTCVGAKVEQHCKDLRWFCQHGSISSRQLLLDLSTLPMHLRSAFYESLEECHAKQTAPEQTSALERRQFVSRHVLAFFVRTAESTCVAQVGRSHCLGLLRTAFVLTRIMSLMRLTRYERSAERVICFCLVHVADTFNKLEDDQDNEQSQSRLHINEQKRQLYCLLVPELLHVMEHAAQNCQSSQHRAKAACQMLSAITFHEASDISVVGQLMLDAGLINVAMTTLEQALSWAVDACGLLHAIRLVLQPAHKDSILQLHGIKLFSHLLFPNLNFLSEHDFIRLGLLLSKGHMHHLKPSRYPTAQSQQPVVVTCDVGASTASVAKANDHQSNSEINSRLDMFAAVAESAGKWPLHWTDGSSESDAQQLAGQFGTVSMAAHFLKFLLGSLPSHKLGTDDQSQPQEAGTGSDNLPVAEQLKAALQQEFEERLQAALATFAALKHVLKLQVHVTKTKSLKGLGQAMEELEEDLVALALDLLEPYFLSGSTAPSVTPEVIWVGLAAVMPYLAGVLVNEKPCKLVTCLMSCLLLPNEQQLPIRANHAPVVWSGMNQLFDNGMGYCPVIVQEQPASLHAIYGLLDHKAFMSWVANDSAKTQQLERSACSFLSEVTENGFCSEAAFLAAACLLKIWQLEHPGIPDDQDADGADSLNEVKACLQQMCEERGSVSFTPVRPESDAEPLVAAKDEYQWTRAEGLAAARLMQAFSQLPNNLQECLELDLKLLMGFCVRVVSLASDDETRLVLFEGAALMLGTHKAALAKWKVQGDHHDAAYRTMALTDLYASSSDVGKGVAMNLRLYNTCGTSSVSFPVARAILLGGIASLVGAASPSEQRTQCLDYFYKHAFEEAQEEAMMMATMAWQQLGSRSLESNMSLWGTVPDQRTVRQLVLHAASICQMDTSQECSHCPSGIGKLVYILVYEVLACTWRSSTSSSRLHKANSSKESRLDSRSAHTDEYADKCLELVARWCTYPVWQAQFDELGSSTADEDIAVVSQMQQLEGKLKASHVLSRQAQAALDQLLHKAKVRSADRAVQQLLAEEDAVQARAQAKQAKKLRQKAKKQQSMLQKRANEQPHSVAADQPAYVSEQQPLDDGAAQFEQLEQHEQQVWLNKPACHMPLSNQDKQLSNMTQDMQSLHLAQSSGLARPLYSFASSDMVHQDNQKQHAESVDGCCNATATSGSGKDACQGDANLRAGHLFDMSRLLCCPLTQAVMHDPVIAADGHTYERVAVEQWLQHHGTSPITGAQLAHKRLIPNVVIRAAIQIH